MPDSAKTFYASRLGTGDSVPISEGKAAIIGSHESCRIQIEGDRVGAQHAILKLVDDALTVEHVTKTPNKVTVIVSGEGEQIKELAANAETSAIVKPGMKLRIDAHEICVSNKPAGLHRREGHSQLDLQLVGDQGDTPNLSTLNLTRSNDRGSDSQINLLMKSADDWHKGKTFEESTQRALTAASEFLPQAQRGAVLLIDENGGLESIADWQQSELDNRSISISTSVLAEASTGEVVINKNAGAGAQHGQSALDLAGVSVMVVPILAGSGKKGEEEDGPKVIGYVQLEADSSDPFEDENMPLAHSLSTILGQKLHEFKALELEASKAGIEQSLEKMQISLAAANLTQMQIMDSDAQIDGYAASGVFMPSESSGGDWMVSEETPDGDLIRILGDVSGHGDKVGPIANALASTARAYIKQGASPEEIIGATNDELQRIAMGTFSTLTLYHIPNPIEKKKRATLSPMRLVDMAMGGKPTTRPIRRYSAGSTNGLIVNKEGEVRRMSTEGKGLPLGIVEAKELLPSIKPQKVKAKPGDTLIEQTDGTSETFRETDSPEESERQYDTQDYNYGRIIESIERAVTSAPNGTDIEKAQHIALEIVAGAKEFQGSKAKGSPDDISVMTTMVKV